MDSIFSECRYYTVWVANNQGADRTARTRMLICDFVVEYGIRQVFSRRSSIYFVFEIESVSICLGWLTFKTIPESFCADFSIESDPTACTTLPTSFKTKLLPSLILQVNRLGGVITY